MEPRPLAIVDIDGVVADVRHRLRHVRRHPKDWNRFFAAAPRDPVHEEGLALVHELAEDHDVVFLTGRPERTRQDTETWLGDHGLGGHPVVMRDEGDRRPAAQVKLELLRALARHRRIAVVVDDDARVVETLRGDGWNVRHADWERRPEAEQAALDAAQEAEGRT